MDKYHAFELGFVFLSEIYTKSFKKVIENYQKSVII